jgi:hypothetical protein
VVVRRPPHPDPVWLHPPPLRGELSGVRPQLANPRRGCRHRAKHAIAQPSQLDLFPTSARTPAARPQSPPSRSRPPALARTTSSARSRPPESAPG